MKCLSLLRVVAAVPAGTGNHVDYRKGVGRPKEQVLSDWGLKKGKGVTRTLPPPVLAVVYRKMHFDLRTEVLGADPATAN